MSQFLKCVSNLLNKHPRKTQMFTTGILMSASDIICQTAIEKCKIREMEPLRIGRFGLLGFCFVAPTLRIWYNVLEKVFGTAGKSVVLKKVLLDQLLFSPCFTGCFLVVSGFIQFQPWQKITMKIREEYFTIVKTSYMIWPAAQIINFNVIPLPARPIFVSSVALVWNTYLASRTNKSCDT